jgi:hypothetical protein
MIPVSIYEKLMETILAPGIKKAAYFHSEKEVAKVTLRGKRDKRDRHSTFLVTIGRPNYDEREFIKKCKKAGEPFPVKKIQVKLEVKKNK